MTDSAKTGDWHTGDTWVGGVAPGNNDGGRINVGHVVTVAAGHPVQALGWNLNGGGIVFNDDFTYTDAPGAAGSINPVSTCSVTNNGTPSSPRTMKSSSNNPTYPWCIIVGELTTFDPRTLNFECIHMKGSQWVIGNATNYVLFNVAGGSGSWALVVPPMSRDPINIEHPIDQRPYSRIYSRGAHAGTVPITGYMPWASWQWVTLAALQASGARFSVFTERVHIPKARFDGKIRFMPKAGDPKVDFSVSIVEDR